MKIIHVVAATAVACALSACSPSLSRGSAAGQGIVPDVPSSSQRTARDTSSTPFDSSGEPYQEDGSPENYPSGTGGSTNGCGERVCPQATSVVNAIVALKSTAIVSYSQGKYASNTVTIGWVYRDGDGHYWVQQNVSTAPDFSVGVSAFFASFAINFKNDNSIKYAGTTAPKMGTNQTYRDCWPKSAGTKFLG